MMVRRLAPLALALAVCSPPAFADDSEQLLMVDHYVNVKSTVIVVLRARVTRSCLAGVNPASSVVML